MKAMYFKDDSPQYFLLTQLENKIAQKMNVLVMDGSTDEKFPFVNSDHYSLPDLIKKQLAAEGKEEAIDSDVSLKYYRAAGINLCLYIMIYNDNTSVCLHQANLTTMCGWHADKCSLCPFHLPISYEDKVEQTQELLVLAQSLGEECTVDKVREIFAKWECRE